MANSEDVAHRRFWIQPDSSPLLLMFSGLPASSLTVNSLLDRRKSCRPDLVNRLILRRDEVRETMQLGQSSQIVCAKLIFQKILTSFSSLFPKATLIMKGVQNVEMKIICMICLHIIFKLIYYLNTKESFSFSILLLLPLDVLVPAKSGGWYLIRYVQLQPRFLLFFILAPSSMADVSPFSFSILTISLAI